MAHIGAQYMLSKGSSLDFGYAHEFIATASINNGVAGVQGRLIGEMDNSVDIFQRAVQPPVLTF